MSIAMYDLRAVVKRNGDNQQIGSGNRQSLHSARSSEFPRFVPNKIVHMKEHERINKALNLRALILSPSAVPQLQHYQRTCRRFAGSKNMSHLTLYFGVAILSESLNPCRGIDEYAQLLPLEASSSSDVMNSSNVPITSASRVILIFRL